MTARHAGATVLAVIWLLALPALAGESKEAKRQREAAEGVAAFDRAMAFYQQGAYAEAEKEFRTAEKKTDNKVPDYVLAAAENYLKLDKPDEALKRYEKLYKKDPTHVRALYGMAESYEEMQNYREAVRMWLRYVKVGVSPPQKLKASNSKLSCFLGKLLESGNPVGQLAFSRENEAQADRLGVHIAFDAGYDPRGRTSIFQTFESMSVLTQFVGPDGADASILDRSRERGERVREPAAVAADEDDVAGLPAHEGTAQDAAVGARCHRPAARGAGFHPGPPGAPGAANHLLQRERPAVQGGDPADWGIRNAESGIIFEGKEGTEAYQVTVQLELVEKQSLPGTSLGDLAEYVRGSLRDRPDAAVEEPTQHKTSEGRDAWVIRSRYTQQNSQGRSFPYRRMNVVIEYPGYFVSFAYYGVDSLFDKYMDRFELIGERFRHTGS